MNPLSVARIRDVPTRDVAAGLPWTNSGSTQYRHCSRTISPSERRNSSTVLPQVVDRTSLLPSGDRAK